MCEPPGCDDRLLGHGVLLVGFRFVMAWATGFALVELFGFSGPKHGVFILMCRMPVSVATELFLQLFASERAGDATGMILVSTLTNVIVVPIMLAQGL